MNEVESLPCHQVPAKGTCVTTLATVGCGGAAGDDDTRAPNSARAIDSKVALKPLATTSSQASATAAEIHAPTRRALSASIATLLTIMVTVHFSTATTRGLEHRGVIHSVNMTG